MKVAVFGATGGTGRNFVQQALEAGYEVSVLVRDPARLALDHKHLAVIHGDVLDPEPVLQTLAGVDAVVVALGNTPNNPQMVCSLGTRNIVWAMQANGAPQRLVVVTSLGVGDSVNQVPRFFKILMKTALRGAMADKEAQETVVRESGLPWIIVRPGGLTDDPPQGSYRAGTEPDIVAGQISRADLAAFLLEQLSDDTYLYQTPAIT